MNIQYIPIHGTLNFNHFIKITSEVVENGRSCYPIPCDIRFTRVARNALGSIIEYVACDIDSGRHDIHH